MQDVGRVAPVVDLAAYLGLENREVLLVETFGPLTENVRQQERGDAGVEIFLPIGEVVPELARLVVAVDRFGERRESVDAPLHLRETGDGGARDPVLASRD